MAATEWGALMAAAQAGHGGAYRRLLGEIRPWLLRYYARRLPPGCVDDAVQEAMIAVHTKRATFDPARPFGPWLAAIARYKWIDRLRAMKRTAAAALPDDIAIGDHETAVTSASVLTALLATLKGPQAAAIRLVKLDGAVDRGGRRRDRPIAQPRQGQYPSRPRPPDGDACGPTRSRVRSGPRPWLITVSP